ncbi:amidohydrolase family protein [Demequina oxidasica]|uniref:amidohydrolase family protein n=1 Tax=Demequina oxidasica TaxID=676199 RepID=UPI0007809E1D|nr:amidohydrolase family protein [Demequina oxidasica]
MTQRRIIDAHTHIWDLDRAEYSWLTPDLSPIYRTFHLDEVAPDLEACGIDSVVLVQASDTDADTNHMLNVAERNPMVTGVVAWLPLDDADALADRIEVLLATGCVVGIRTLIQDMADDEWILRPAVQPGLDTIAEAGLSFDYVTANPTALRHVPALATLHPNLRIVIDHLGKPPVGDDADAMGRWRGLLDEAAAAPNVAAKISGLTASVGPPDNWTVDSFRPVVETAVAAFGAERLMYGGDWPVVNLAGGYARWFEGISQILEELSADELDSIYSETATAWYGLDKRKGTV